MKTKNPTQGLNSPPHQHEKNEPKNSPLSKTLPDPDIQTSNNSSSIPEDQKDVILQVIVEKVIASVAFIFFLPVMICIGLYIKIGTPGPAVFFQDRLGKGGKQFKFIKFRTMYVDARERFPELYAYSYDPTELKELKFKVKHDPRVTPQGRWLRKSTLDELPNFWNVINGSMSLIGPRPEIPEMLPYYEEEMLEKFTVRPGVTGLAQASGRGELGFFETVELDVNYVRRRSPWFDFKIFWLTLWKVVKREGAF